MTMAPPGKKGARSGAPSSNATDSSNGGKKPKSQTVSPPPLDQWMKPAIGVGLALLAFQFYRGLRAEILRVNILDEVELREIFFGEGGKGVSYVVLCHDEASNVPISSVFQDAHKDGTVPAEFRLLDCNYLLPDSEKTVAQRFDLNLEERPTVFISGTIGAPQQIPTKHLKTGAMLVKALRSKLEVRAVKTETTQDLRTKCLDKQYCGLLLKGGKKAPNWLKDAMTKLMKTYDNVVFASMDASVLYAKNLEEFLPEMQKDEARFVMFSKVSGTSQPGGDRLITSIATIPEGTSVSFNSMNDLVAGVTSQTQSMTKIPQLPMIKTRTKKLEQEEREKRQRKLQQQQRQQQKQEDPSSSSSSSGANDGSREGRRAERERRRAEHNAAHNVKPKTPEEIAEMERKRRARMEEEAAKWNMGPEDLAAAEAAAAAEGRESFFEEAEGEGQYYDDLDSEEGDGEEVIDLD